MARIITVRYPRTPRNRREAAPIARHAAAALLLSNSIRRDTEFKALFEDTGKMLRLKGSTLRNLRADEESAVGLIWSLIRRGVLENLEHTVYTCIRVEEEASLSCNSPDQWCQQGGTPILINPPSTDSVYCGSILPLPPAPTLTHTIILVNMVLDQCKRTLQY